MQATKLTNKDLLSDQMVSMAFVSIPSLLFMVAFCIKLSFLFSRYFGIENPYILYGASAALSVPSSNTVFNVTINRNLLKYPAFTIGLFTVASFLMWMLSFNAEDVIKQQDYFKLGCIFILSLFLCLCEKVSALLVARKKNEESVSIKKVYNSLLESYNSLNESYSSLKSSKESLTNDYDSLKLANDSLTKNLANYVEQLTCGNCGTKHTTVSRMRNCKCDTK